MQLLPGDAAPDLAVEHFLNSEGPRPIIFDRPSFITLWNAGCSGCLPAIDALAEFAASQNVLCFGVAVMVRDMEATAAAARLASSDAVLCIERRDPNRMGMARGAVTRQWLEASGRNSVPTTFVVDGNGVLAWIGQPEDAPKVMESVVAGTWDFGKARSEEWSITAPGAVARQVTIMDLTEAVMTGQLQEAAKLIQNAERSVPRLDNEPQFVTLKLQVLAGVDEEAAGRYYTQAAPMFKGDAGLQTTLAVTALTGLRNPQSVADAAAENLGVVVSTSTGLPPDLRAISSVLLAKAMALRGETAAALAVLDRVGKEMDSGGVPERAAKWCRKQVGQIAADLHNVRTE
jgi:hypothetical protein